MAFKSCNHPIEICLRSFPLRLLCILIRLAKLLIVQKHQIHKNNAIQAHAMHMHSGLRYLVFSLRTGLRPPVLGLRPQCFVFVQGLGPRCFIFVPGLGPQFSYACCMSYTYASCLKQYTFHFINHAVNPCLLYKT